MQGGGRQGVSHSSLGGSEAKVSWSWPWRVVEERGKQGLYVGVLLCLTSLSGLFSGFCMVFFLADLVWFLNRLVYIFSAKLCKWKKTKRFKMKRPARRTCCIYGK